MTWLLVYKYTCTDLDGSAYVKFNFYRVTGTTLILFIYFGPNHASMKIIQIQWLWT